jgi:ATP-dependent helicase HrpB
MVPAMTDWQDAVNSQDLPVGTVLPQLRGLLTRADQVILQAEPGAGKTTLVPLALHEEAWLAGRKVLMLEPRRIAARAAAERMASLLGEKVGELVGYRMRGDTKVSRGTRIEVLTDGVFTRMLQSDPGLDDAGLVIFDEYHERSLDSDLGLALAWRGRELLRASDEPLKFLFMSATLESDGLSALLDEAPVLNCPGRSFPVELHYHPRRPPRAQLATEVVATVRRVLRETSGSLLVFLPGRAEIQAVAAALELPDEILVAPLYGGLSLVEQRLAVVAPAAGARKVVLATNIAETSLTIEGVNTVIDTGLVREPVFQSASGMTRLATVTVSKASSIQRMGRAGRLEAGRCYRLWTEEQQGRLVPQATPEILQADLSAVALALLAWGVEDPGELRWLDAPPAAAWRGALRLLRSLGATAIAEEGHLVLTTHGKHMAALPLPARLAHLLLTAAASDLVETGSLLAAVLLEQQAAGGCDLESQLEGLARRSTTSRDQAVSASRIRAEARRYRRAAEGLPRGAVTVLPEDAAGYLLASAWPERIARRVAGSRYQLATGQQVILSRDDALQRQDWLVVPETGGRDGGRVARACRFNPALLDDVLGGLLETREYLGWDRRTDRLVTEAREMLGSMVLRRLPMAKVDPQRRRAVILDEIRRRGIDALHWSEEARQWRARVSLLSTLDLPAAVRFPDLSDAALLDGLEEWLAPLVDGVTSGEDIARIDVLAALKSRLSWEQSRSLDEFAPARWRVPTGNRRAIDYLDHPPVLAVKLQEMFGCEETPSIAAGQVLLVVHLLSPAGRPLQVTSDLAGFWRNGYAAVRKEMRGRYPKHPWPEDPLTATPAAGTSRR